MTKATQRVLSLLLAAVLLFGMFPMSAFAAETEQTGIAAPEVDVTDPPEAAESEPVEGVNNDTAPAETTPAEAEPVETTAPTTEPEVTHGEETQPVETMPETTHGEEVTEPVETVPDETEPVETEPPATEAPTQPTEPPGCQHDWKCIHHEEVGHWRAGIMCDCGWTVYGDPDELVALWNAHSASYPAAESLFDHGGYGSADEWIVDTPAYDEWVCRHCGEPKP